MAKIDEFTSLDEKEMRQMLMSYALAVSFALAFTGLVNEAATQWKWSRRRKRWGVLFAAAGAMGIVPLVAEQFSQLAVAVVTAGCILALSLRGYGPAASVPAADEPEVPEVVTEEFAVEESVMEILAVEEPVVEEPKTEVIAAEMPVAEELGEAPATQIHSEEWLNRQIALGYEAKAKSDWASARAAFAEAVNACADRELLAMLEEEVRLCEAQCLTEADRYRSAS